MITVRQTTELDEIGIRNLFKICFGKELSQSEWCWKYKDSYLGSSSFLAEDDGRIVAHYGGIKTRFYSRGTFFDAYQGCDVMTHPDYRARFFSRRGIVIRVAEAFYDANPMDFIFGFPSERHGKLMALQLRWETYRIIHVLKKDCSKLRRHRNLLLKIETDWDSLAPHEIDRMWAESRNFYELSIEKDSRYIRWRYRNNPRQKYEIVSFRGLLRRDLKALLIFKIENDNLFILDFFVSRDMNPGKAITLIEDIAVIKGARSISVWVNPREGIYEDFKRALYREEQDIPYSVRIFEEPKISGGYFLDQYCYRYGDYDAA
jgi:Acetyltransferase (GNAT) domain